ncbi:glycopeptide antibiotics resistance protein [Lentilactobacillus fungorum]|uniref:Glycopeptide antibiotics resistance protein n=1 Tax=Lentilactobacillus fungorum TaxID=2201250 RepID=A0ABQ3W004_9LACO|nr:VanZ family protein [Lentilactobacillus fungorum]GHP13887.1 glycopeptide antibiotics resistance protein [Lentilactobacillus fungorum]
MSQYIHVIYTAAIFFPIIALIITLPILIVNYHRYGALPKWNIFMLYTFVFYMICAYFLTILPLPSRSFVAHLTTPTHNFVPFTFVTNFFKYNPFSLTHPGTWLAALKAPTVIQPAFNLLLTLPFGFYLRYYFNRNWKQTILLSFCLSLFYELTQLSGLYGIYPRPYRLFDVDDLLLNTLGGLLGGGLASLFSKVLPSKQKVRQSAAARSQNVSPLRRGTALAVDWIIIAIISDLLNLIIGPRWLLTFIAWAILIIGAEIANQRTIGMRVVGIRLTNQFGQAASSLQIILRNAIAYGIIGGTFAIQGRLLDMTGYAPVSELTTIKNIVLALSFVLLLILVDLLIETFSQKHRLFFERLSGTDTKASRYH